MEKCAHFFYTIKNSFSTFQNLYFYGTLFPSMEVNNESPYSCSFLIIAWQIQLNVIRAFKNLLFYSFFLLENHRY